MSADDAFARWPLELDEIYGCWRWTANVGQDGYGRVVRRGQRPQLAHRYVYARLVGPIAEDRELDHTCRRRDCVRPEHLEPVTRRENVKRMAWRNRAKRKDCPRGHDLYLHGRRTPEGGIVCRTCCDLK